MLSRPIELQDLIFYLVEQGELDYQKNTEYHYLVCDLLKKYQAPTVLYDKVLSRHLSSIGERRTPLGSVTLLARSFSLCQYASRDIVEQVLDQLIRNGLYNHATRAAALLDRKLTEEEVLKLVESYTQGAVRSGTQEETLLDIAEQCDDPSVVKTVNRQFAEMREQDRFEVY